MRTEACQAYRSIYLPSITYLLGVMAISPKDAYNVQKNALSAFLSAQGINHNMHRAVVFGPDLHGSLNLRCLYTEQGCQQIEFLLDHLCLGDRIGHQIANTLSILQLTASTCRPILNDTTTPLPHLPTGWFTSIRDFLGHIGGQIDIPNSLHLNRARVNDWLLMDMFLGDTSLSLATVQKLNHCHLYLQVTILADICDGKGLAILADAFHGCQLSDSTSHWLWPRQKLPPITSWKIWRTTLHQSPVGKSGVQLCAATFSSQTPAIFAYVLSGTWANGSP